MNRLVIPALLAIALLSSGCATQYPLDAGNSAIVSTKAPGSSETNYRKLLDLATEKCFRLAAQAQYYPQAKEGEFSLVTLATGGGSRFTWVRFLVAQSSPDSSTITITYKKDFSDFKDAGLAWAAGNPVKCPYHING